MNLKEMTESLKEPFAYKDVEWRISRVFKSGKATVLAYITSRAVMDRLDEIFGIDGWQDEYEFINDNVTCKLKVKMGDEWVYKMDGAQQTAFESFKGGISDALKRTAVKLGIGRYLYNLTESWVDIVSDKPKGVNRNYVHYVNDKNTGIKGYWVSPELPIWALPKNSKNSVSPKSEIGWNKVYDRKETTEPAKKTTETSMKTTEPEERTNPIFETFKDEMEKVQSRLGKDKFFAKLGSLGYEDLNDLRSAETNVLNKILIKMNRAE